MLKYAKIINEETKLCEVGVGTDSDFYQSIGMTLQDVEEAWNGSWYLKGYAPERPAPTKEDIGLLRSDEYYLKTDRLVCEYMRKKLLNLFKDGEEAEILKEISSRSAQIKAENPYPVEESEELPAVDEVVVSKMENTEESDVTEDVLQM